ncbi:hypothetical protein OSB04_031133 [Centaurea solstitialis]|uniref:HAT C-terminal dimerisation domain-containing protein n=1 Tax=Centaurea solstitialis TaxID=347529 RepID=A0AA38W4G0_9ASTR|nr:hypothetical protein OSB04_031133 [Centaurea solstitialis]
MTFQEWENLDLLAWWKEKEPQFPILAAMAYNLLTVQASTVASESAFSDCLDGAVRMQHLTTLEDAIDVDAKATVHNEEVELGISTNDDEEDEEEEDDDDIATANNMTTILSD